MRMCFIFIAPQYLDKMNMTLFVNSLENNPYRGTLRFMGRSFPCALGRGGITRNKKEGDGCTPAGIFKLHTPLIRQDKMTQRQRFFFSHTPHHPITKQDGWSDDPRDALYNMLVALPHRYSHEQLWRKDDIYDVIVPLGYNDMPCQSGGVKKGRGSAIFLHLSTKKLEPTKGCIAIARDHMWEILPRLTPNIKIAISLLGRATQK